MQVRDTEKAYGGSLQTPGGHEAARAFLAAMTDAEGRPAEHIETHISHIYLIGDRAYKIKKPLLLPFLDFSTLEKRRAACAREIEVNIDPEHRIYLGVAPVLYGANRQVYLGEIGERPEPGQPVADYVVAMRRFDRGAELHVLAEHGGLRAGHVTLLADEIARRQEAAPRARHAAGWPREIERVIQNIVAQLGPRADAWRDAMRDSLHALSPRLASRRRHGFVRRCHGDLHLGNICLIDGQPTPFDAIEFSEEIATVDVAYDAAFTAMDLYDHRLGDLASRFTARYFNESRDLHALAAWPFFCSLRAGVRAMTASFAGETEVADRRLGLAERLLAPKPRRMIAIGGLSGTGKTTLAYRLAALIGPSALVISSDALRKRRFGVAPEAQLPQAAYLPDENAAVYAEVAREARRALANGATAIVDAVFKRAQERVAIRETAAAAGVRFDGMWLDLPRATRLARVSARSAMAEADPAAAGGSDARLAVAAMQRRSKLGPIEWTSLDASAHCGGYLQAARWLELDGAVC